MNFRYPVLIPDMPSRDRLMPYLKRIDDAMWYTNFGALEKELRERLSVLHGGAEVVTVSSNTLGLELCLAAMGIYLPTKSERMLVACPSFTFPATATAIRRVGAEPLWCDVDPKTWSFTPPASTVDGAVPVAAFGAMPTFTYPKGLRKCIVIDAAAAFHNSFMPVGAEDFPRVYSLHATKSLGAGEGGYVVTRDKAIAEELMAMTNFGFGAGRLIRSHGGTNAKLSEYHAAVALASLDRWPQIAVRRRNLADFYRTVLEVLCPDLEYQQRDESDVRVTFEVLLPRGTDILRVIAALEADGVETRRWYWPPLHLHPALYGVDGGMFDSKRLPVTMNLGARLLGLPFHTFLSEADVEFVCRALAAAVERSSL